MKIFESINNGNPVEIDVDEKVHLPAKALNSYRIIKVSFTYNNGDLVNWTSVNAEGK